MPILYIIMTRHYEFSFRDKSFYSDEASYLAELVQELCQNRTVPHRAPSGLDGNRRHAMMIQKERYGHHDQRRHQLDRRADRGDPDGDEHLPSWVSPPADEQILGDFDDDGAGDEQVKPGGRETAALHQISSNHAGATFAIPH